MSWNEPITELLVSATRFIPYFNCRRVASVGMTNSEWLSLMGLSFIAEIDVTLADGASQYYHFVAPSDRDVQILVRELSPDITGAEYNLYLSSTGITDGSSILTVKTNPTTGVTSTSSIHLLNAAPTTPGNFTTPIFIGKGGASNANGRSGGTDSGKNGLINYAAGTGFVARIHNFRKL